MRKLKKLPQRGCGAQLESRSEWIVSAGRFSAGPGCWAGGLGALTGNPTITHPVSEGRREGQVRLLLQQGGEGWDMPSSAGVNVTQKFFSL